MIMSSLHHITPEHRQGEALGLRLMTVNLSSVAMPILFGSLSAIVSLSFVFFGASMVLSMGARLATGLKAGDATH
jgi:hypothetical protein